MYAVAPRAQHTHTHTHTYIEQPNPPPFERAATAVGDLDRGNINPQLHSSAEARHDALHVSYICNFYKHCATIFEITRFRAMTIINVGWHLS